jgi:hypothetical protein
MSPFPSCAKIAPYCDTLHAWDLITSTLCLWDAGVYDLMFTIS